MRERGVAHPREVDAHFEHGRVTNWFGGSSNASTKLLDHMHYRGLLRVARRDGGTRVYIAREAALAELPMAPAEAKALAASRMDALVDVIVRKYAPLPGGSLANLVNRLQYAAPQWAGERRAALVRAKQRLPPRTRRRHRVVLAAGGEAAVGAVAARRCGASADALRSGGVGPAPLRDFLELDLSFRGLYTRAETQARLLRAALAVA